MKRKDFIKSTLFGSIAGMALPSLIGGKEEAKEKSTTQIGFNHLPNKEVHKMNKIIHKAETRGHANHGWLDSHHTFSFANYYNPDRMNFGVLRVLNDDIVQGGKGFSTHPHDNMEIISIPLKGDLEHKDSMNNVAVIKEGDVQVMSAGTGVYHSEYNKNKDKDVKFLQIWVYPNKKQVEPRYDQISIRDIEKQNAFYQILSPNKGEQGVWIHQDAWFHLGKFEKGKTDTYSIKKKGNGVYAFILSGKVNIEGEELSARDGMGISNVSEFTVKATEEAQILLMEIPMKATQ